MRLPDFGCWNANDHVRSLRREDAPASIRAVRHFGHAQPLTFHVPGSRLLPPATRIALLRVISAAHHASPFHSKWGPSPTAPGTCSCSATRTHECFRSTLCTFAPRMPYLSLLRRACAPVPLLRSQGALPWLPLSLRSFRQAPATPWAPGHPSLCACAGGSCGARRGERGDGARKAHPTWPCPLALASQPRCILLSSQTLLPAGCNNLHLSTPTGAHRPCNTTTVEAQQSASTHQRRARRGCRLNSSAQA